MVQFSLRDAMCAQLRDAGEEHLRDIVEPFLDVALKLALEHEGDAALPLELVEEVAGQVSIVAANTLWALLEARRDLLQKPTFIPLKGNPRSKLALLRTANSLLRRLPQLGDAAMELRGRILVFLAYILPLSERSGVNVTGKFNTNNRTEYEDADSSERDQGSSPVDFQLYQSFWRLQSTFVDPTQVLRSADSWGQFREDIQATLEAWENRSSDNLAAEGDGSGPASSGEEAKESASSSENTLVGVKFLTSRRLFGLQLVDISLRRHVLIQCLICLRFLSHTSLTPAAGVDTETAVPNLEQRVISLLEKSGPDGKAFTASVRRILAREQAWVQWKANSCPPIEQELPSPHRVRDLRAKRSRESLTEGDLDPAKTLAALKRRRVWMAAGEGEQLSELTRTLGAEPQPSLSDYVDELREAFDPNNPFADPDMGPQTDPGWVWRGMRLLAAERPDLLPHATRDHRSFTDILVDEFKLPRPPKAREEKEETDEAEKKDSGSAGKEKEDVSPKREHRDKKTKQSKSGRRGASSGTERKMEDDGGEDDSAQPSGAKEDESAS